MSLFLPAYYQNIGRGVKHFRVQIEGIGCGSPKQVVRSLNQAGIIDDAQTVKALEMVDDRNSTVHTYDEKLANSVFEHIRIYAPLIREVLSLMEARE